MPGSDSCRVAKRDALALQLPMWRLTREHPGVGRQVAYGESRLTGTRQAIRPSPKRRYHTDCESRDSRAAAVTHRIPCRRPVGLSLPLKLRLLLIRQLLRHQGPGTWHSAQRMPSAASVGASLRESHVCSSSGGCVILLRGKRMERISGQKATQGTLPNCRTHPRLRDRRRAGGVLPRPVRV